MPITDDFTHERNFIDERNGFTELQRLSQTFRYEKVKVGSEEALLLIVTTRIYLQLPDIAPGELFLGMYPDVELRWMKGEMAYMLTHAGYYSYDNTAFNVEPVMDMLIAIAESVG